MKHWKKCWQKCNAIINALSRFLALTVIEFYRLVLASFMGGACRFEPSCSSYAQSAFIQYPPWRALKLSLIRLSKCHPFGPYGFDPLPKSREGMSREGIQ